MLWFEFAAYDFLFSLSTVVPLFVVVYVILDARDRKQERKKMFI
jgi:hypothetical protein